MKYLYKYSSPLGGITLECEGSALTGLWFDGQKHFAAAPDAREADGSLPAFEQAARWLDIYFGGRDPGFFPKTAPEGTPFQAAVWEILLTVPYGETVTYGEIARRIAEKTGLSRMSARAVGGAVGRNPISLIIPCHRVVGAGGKLTGYAGGIDRKEKLLALEKAGCCSLASLY